MCTRGKKLFQVIRSTKAFPAIEALVDEDLGSYLVRTLRVCGVSGRSAMHGLPWGPDGTKGGDGKRAREKSHIF